GARKFGNVELLAPSHAVEDRPRLVNGDEIEIDALDLHLPGIERLHAAVEAARKRKLQLCHLLPSPVPLRSLQPYHARATAENPDGPVHRRRLHVLVLCVRQALLEASCAGGSAWERKEPN